MEANFLLHSDFIDIITKWNPTYNFSIDEYNIGSGIARVKIHSLLNPDSCFQFDKVTFFFIPKNVTQSEFSKLYIIKDLVNSDEYNSDLSIMLFEEEKIEIRVIRFLVTELKRKTSLFFINELTVSKKILQDILNKGSLVKYSEVIPLKSFTHLSRGFQGLILKINKLYDGEFWEEVLINIRKLVENTIHVWWKKNNNNNDDELRNPDDGKVKPLERRLNLVREKNGITINDVRRLLAVKGMGDLSAHNVNFIASKTDAIMGISEVKKLVNQLLPP